MRILTGGIVVHTENEVKPGWPWDWLVAGTGDPAAAMESRPTLFCIA